MLSEKRAHFALVSLCLASRALVALDFGPVFYIWPATNMPYAGSFQNEEVCLPSMLHWVHPLRRESPGALWRAPPTILESQSWSPPDPGALVPLSMHCRGAAVHLFSYPRADTSGLCTFP